MNSNLMSLKYMEKLEILKRNTSIFAYIGLDDMKTEGTFVWHDDKTVIKTEMIRKLFKSGEPNNGNNNENCARYEPVNFALNDAVCSDYIRYICEKLCFHW
ncbi:perlucin protein [Biomphalaria glabrata]|nr:perlucin protein [Biomphalaria glabrata]